MKRLLSFFFLACAAFFVISCSKESSVKSNIEGTWGLTHVESWKKTNGTITDQESYDFNPYAPGDSDGGMKFVIGSIQLMIEHLQFLIEFEELSTDAIYPLHLSVYQNNCYNEAQ